MSHSVSSVAPIIEMAGEKKSIFRSKALLSYSDREQQPASYTLVTPRSLYLLWVLLVLVVFFGVVAWLSKIPVYTPAMAVTIGAHARQEEPTASITIVILVPADQLDNLRVGQNVVFKLNSSPYRVTAKIFAVEPEVLSPQAAQKRFDPGIQSSNIGEPKAVALARVAPPASSALLDNCRRGPVDAWVQTDSKPVVSLFPFMGRVVQPPDEQETVEPIAHPGLVRVSHIRKGEFFERYPMRASSCLLREKSLQSTNQKTKRRRNFVCVN